MLLLTNPVRDYAWGSQHRLAQFLGREPSGGSEAELWIGAHEGDPSLLPDGTRLDEAIAADPVGLLGERVHAEHGARLPFLMKVLAVEEPLSLQVHPSAEQARLGFQREEHAGVALDAPHRSFKDPWHKPELIYALTRFEGMAGFRDVARSGSLLRLLDHPWAARTAGVLESDRPARTLRAVVRETLQLPAAEVEDLLGGLARAAHATAEAGHRRERTRGAARSGRDVASDAVQREAIRVFELFPTLAERYPRDPGVLVTLLLNHVVLAPGEALYVDSGVLHAYTSGFGVEIMAASDNVLRAGLTSKHRDAARLVEATRFEPAPARRIGRPGDHDLSVAGVCDFGLWVGRPEDLDFPAAGPRIVLCLGGTATLRAPGGSASLRRGESLLSTGTITAGSGSEDCTVAVGYVP